MPGFIRICGIDYELVADEMVGRENHNLGEFRPGRAQIAIDPKCPPQQINQTLIHEILEAIKWNLSLTLNHAELTAIAAMLHAVLLDNRDVFWLVLDQKPPQFESVPT